MLKQPKYAPVPVDEQVGSIYAVTNGFADDVPVADIQRFEAELSDYMRSRHGKLLDVINDTGQLPDGEELKAAIDAFKVSFTGSGE